MGSILQVGKGATDVESQNTAAHGIFLPSSPAIPI